MTIEATPLGVQCYRRCVYCYQETVRAEQTRPAYDLAAMQATLAALGQPFALHGGDPLLLPPADLEALWAFGLTRFGEMAAQQGRAPNGIQTDGALLRPEHIRLFKQYRVAVGLSIDGPDELNDARAMPGGLAATRAATSKTLAAIDQLLAAGIVPSLIVTLHAHNARGDRLARLVAWLESLFARGIQHVNCHFLEVDSAATEAIALTTEELVAAVLALRNLEAPGRTIEPLASMRRLLTDPGEIEALLPQGSGQARTLCIWNACDPYRTDAVWGVDGQGQLKNCGRTYKGAIPWAKAAVHGYERYLALYTTPQAYGGCADCRFFLACKGHCPGEAEQRDWRGRTRYCAALQQIFEVLEAELVAAGQTPLSRDDDRRRALETALIAYWTAVTTRGGPASAAGQAWHGDGPHGDTPHADAPHGDHTDAARPVVTHGDAPHSDHTDAGAMSR